jgi:hypothetical protein
MNNHYPDSFSWLDDIIMKHKNKKQSIYLSEPISRENQVEYLMKENYQLKKQNLLLEGMLNEKIELKELNDLKEKQILLMDQKINALERIIEEYKMIQQKIDNIYNSLSYIINTQNINCEMSIEQKLNSIESIVNSLQQQNMKYKEICDLFQQNQNYNKTKLNNNKTNIKYNKDNYLITELEEHFKKNSFKNYLRDKKSKSEKNTSSKSQKQKRKIKI